MSNEPPHGGSPLGRGPDFVNPLLCDGDGGGGGVVFLGGFFWGRGGGGGGGGGHPPPTEPLSLETRLELFNINFGPNS